MRIKPGFNIRQMCGESIIVAQGLANIDFSKIISLNESAAYLWDAVKEQDFTPELMAELLQKEYDIDADTALRDAKELANAWRDAGLCE